MSNDHSGPPAALTAGQSPDRGQPVVIGSGGGFGCCRACGGKLTFSSGWVPTYGDPDNASGAPEAAPVCEKCEAEFERENLRNYEPMSRSATVMPIRLLPNNGSEPRP